LKLKKKKINDFIDEYNSSLEEHNDNHENFMYRCQKFNSRLERWKERIYRYNTNLDRINRSSARLTHEARQSIEQESDYLDEEKSAIESESIYIDCMREDLERSKEYIDKKEEKIDAKLGKIEKKKHEYARKVESTTRKLQEREKFKKNVQDEINFFFQLIKAFDDESSSLDEKIVARINEINVHLQEIGNRLSENYFEQFSLLEDGINELQEVINRCLDEFAILENQIFTFHQEINNCINKLNINKMVTKVLQKTTEHYFDETGEFEYRGSHYHFFRQHGITIGLILTMNTLFGHQKEYEEFYNDLSRTVDQLGLFPDNPVESKVLDLLNSKIDLLFDAKFDQNFLKLLSL
jgi:chromosome segregation ATPase